MSTKFACKACGSVVDVEELPFPKILFFALKFADGELKNAVLCQNCRMPYAYEVTEPTEEASDGRPR